MRIFAVVTLACALTISAAQADTGPYGLTGNDTAGSFPGPPRSTSSTNKWLPTIARGLPKFPVSPAYTAGSATMSGSPAALIETMIR